MREFSSLQKLGFSSPAYPELLAKVQFQMSDAPIQAPYARHIFICTGTYCDPEGKSAALYRSLARKLGELGRYDNPVRVKRGTTPCLGVCYNGPLLVVYPEGIWYHSVDEAVLARIVEEHLSNNQPVQEYIFHRLSDNEERLPCACQEPSVVTSVVPSAR